MVSGAARSLLVTPWFAAGTGFVIATALWVYSPHEELKFPDSAPYSLCQSKGCVNVSPGDGAGSLANSLPGERINGPQTNTGQAARPDVVTGSAAAGLKFRFKILWQQGLHFYAVITVSGHSVPSSWRLSFAIPGVRIDYITGVTWQPARSGNGGTASAENWQYGVNGNGAAGGQNGANANGAGENENGSRDHGNLPVITFAIAGTGSAGLPTSCRFDGATCRFRS